MPVVTDNRSASVRCQRGRRLEGGGSTMKRLLIAVATMFALAAFAAAAATAEQATYTLTLTATPSTLIVGEDTLLAGTLSAIPGTTSVAGYGVTISAYDDAGCSTEPYWSAGGLTTDDNGDYGGYLKLFGVGTYYFAASAAGVTSNCVPVEVSLEGQTTPGTTPVTSAEPSDTIASSYLCWNREMVNPVAYIDRTADEMWKTGRYFEPQAILGNVAGGTNIGAYHLVCNAPDTMKVTGLGLGGSGEVYSAEAMLAYHAAHAGMNDLNIYHIWK